MNPEQNLVTEKHPEPMSNGTVTPWDTSHPPIHQAHHKKNIYPYLRHTLLIIIVLIAFLTIMFLIHQNGKSLYEHGI